MNEGDSRRRGGGRWRDGGEQARRAGFQFQFALGANEVQVDAVMVERMDALIDDARSALRGERIGYTGLKRRGQKVVLQLTKLEKLDAARDLLSDLDREIIVAATDSGAIEISLNETAIAARKSSALSQSIEIIRRRIDETGVSEPTIQRQGDDRILVQLPGLQDPERLKRLLGKTAKMSFHLVDHTVTDADLARGRVPPGTAPGGGAGPWGRGGGDHEFW